MANPKLVVEITPGGFEIDWKNWEGVTNVTIERMHYAIVKNLQVRKAQKLGAMHGERMQAEAAARKAEEDKLAAAKLNEELANAIR